MLIHIKIMLHLSYKNKESGEYPVALIALYNAANTSTVYMYHFFAEFIVYKFITYITKGIIP